MANTRLTTDSAEPLYTMVSVGAGAIFMVNGLEGTAYQVFDSDMKFHGANGKVLSLAQILDLPNVWHIFGTCVVDGDEID